MEWFARGGRVPARVAQVPVARILQTVLLLSLSLSFLTMLLPPLFAASSTNLVASDSEQVIGTSGYGSPSLSSPGGQNLLEDGFGKFIAIYIDYTGRLGVTYANSNP